MNNTFKKIAAFVALSAHSIAIGQNLTKQERAAMALTPDQIAAKADIEGTGELDPALWVSTRSFLPKRGTDRWFRARIDKLTGAVTYQMYIVLQSNGQGFRPNLLTFAGPNGLGNAKVERIDFQPNCSRYGCTVTEDAIATFERSDLERAAIGATPGIDSAWDAKLFGDSVEGLTFSTFKTEIAGFLLAVDGELAKIKPMKN